MGAFKSRGQQINSKDQNKNNGGGGGGGSSSKRFIRSRRNSSSDYNNKAPRYKHVRAPHPHENKE